MNRTFITTKKTIQELYYEPGFSYTIPKYQRPYSWKKENFEEFWKLIEKGEEVFLGTVIYNIDDFDKKNEKEIIDGQQRYLTITILAASLRNSLLEFSKRNNDLSALNKANDIHEALVCRRNKETDKFQNYLHVGATSKDYFSENVQSYNTDGFVNGVEENVPFSKPKSEEEKLIFTAYEFFKKEIDNSISSKGVQDTYLLVYQNLKKLFVISIEIDDYEMAFEIFESVNGQGVDLSVSDLIKNQIFKNIDKSTLLKAEETWIEIIEYLENSGMDISPKEFIRYYWASKYNYIPDSKLYRAIKDEFKSHADKWNNLLVDLHFEAVLLNKLMTYSKGQWQNELGQKNGAEVYHSLRALKAIKGKTWIVLIIALFRNKEKLENLGLKFIKHLDKIQQFTFFYNGIMGLPGNWYWIQMHSTSRKVNNLKDKDKLNDVFLELFKSFGEKLNPSRIDFNEGILGIKYSNTNRSLIRYVLGEIESKLQGVDSSGWDEDKVNIEHFVPQDTKEWGVSKNEVKPYMHTLGNLLIIPARLNGKLQNKTCLDKLEIIRNSQPDMRMLISLVENIESKVWNFQELKESDFAAFKIRQEEMSDIAYKIWVEDLKKKLGY